MDSINNELISSSASPHPHEVISILYGSYQISQSVALPVILRAVVRTSARGIFLHPPDTSLAFSILFLIVMYMYIQP